MNKLRVALFLLICVVASGFPLFAWFRATTAAEVWPPSSQSTVGPKFAVEAGRIMARPAYLFVDKMKFIGAHEATRSGPVAGYSDSWWVESGREGTRRFRGGGFLAAGLAAFVLGSRAGVA